MSAEGSITRWIAELKSDDVDEAREQLWQRYFRRLLGLARLKLGETPQAVVDAEDVVTVALQSFFAEHARGRYPQLQDRHDLWFLLAKITAHKTLDQQRWVMAEKRGGGQVRGDSAMIGPADSLADWPASLLEDEMGPDSLVAITEQCDRLMALLPDEQLRQIVQRRLEGYTNAEIAKELDVIERTVERRLHLIRSLWSAEMQENPPT